MWYPLIAVGLREVSKRHFNLRYNIVSRQSAPTSIEESSSSALLLRQLVVGEADDGEGAYLTQGRFWLSLGT